MNGEKALPHGNRDRWIKIIDSKADDDCDEGKKGLWLNCQFSKTL